MECGSSSHDVRRLVGVIAVFPPRRTTWSAIRLVSMWCPWIASQQGPVVASPPVTSPRFNWLAQASGGGASPCQVQARRFGGRWYPGRGIEWTSRAAAPHVPETFRISWKLRVTPGASRTRHRRDSACLATPGRSGISRCEPSDGGLIPPPPFSKAAGRVSLRAVASTLRSCGVVGRGS